MRRHRKQSLRWFTREIRERHELDALDNNQPIRIRLRIILVSFDPGALIRCVVIVAADVAFHLTVPVLCAVEISSVVVIKPSNREAVEVGGVVAGANVKHAPVR